MSLQSVEQIRFLRGSDVASTLPEDQLTRWHSACYLFWVLNLSAAGEAMQRLRPTMLFSIVLALGLLGCGPKDHGHKNDGLDPLRDALDSTDGDLGTSSESLVASDYGDISPLVANDDSTSVEPQGWGRSITLLAVWGPRPQVEEVDADKSRDWSGYVRVQGGRARVLAKIGFDEGDVIAARTDPTQVDFLSHTQGSVDGMVLRIVQDEPGATVEIHTAPSSLTISLASIRPDLSGSQPVEGSNDALSFHAFSLSTLCTDGFVFGRFRRLGADVGRLHGRVVSDAGLELGRLRGIYGHSRKYDVNALFAKVLQPDGTFWGRVRGAYAQGAFAGDWRYDMSSSSGSLAGRYWEGPAGVAGRGLFFGHWIESCKN